MKAINKSFLMAFSYNFLSLNLLRDPKTFGFIENEGPSRGLLRERIIINENALEISRLILFFYYKEKREKKG